MNQNQNQNQRGIKAIKSLKPQSVLVFKLCLFIFCWIEIVCMTHVWVYSTRSWHNFRVTLTHFCMRPIRSICNHVVSRPTSIFSVCLFVCQKQSSTLFNLRIQYQYILLQSSWSIIFSGYYSSRREKENKIIQVFTRSIFFICHLTLIQYSTNMEIDRAEVTALCEHGFCKNPPICMIAVPSERHHVLAHT